LVIVVDTSVLVSAMLGPGGASREVLRRTLNGRYRPLLGAALLSEYEAAFGRERLFETCPLTARERAEVLDAFLSCCRWTRVYYTWRPNVPDESDNHLVELAIAGGAEALVTKDVNDFQAMELRFPGLRIAVPGDFVKE
jgi:putative PIN family toxin of toxin-antitoxin system